MIDRHKSVLVLRAQIAGASVGAIGAASFWVCAGEIGSEVLHATYRHTQADVPVEEREPLPLGRFDPLDLLYGIGPAVVLVKQRRHEEEMFVKEIQDLLPPMNLPRAYARGIS